MVRLKLLFELDNRFQNELKQFGSVLHIVRFLAVVATSAILLRVFLSEIMEKEFSATDIGGAVVFGFLKQLLTNLFLAALLVLHELVEAVDILVAIVADAMALTTISAGTTRLLIVALKRFGYIVMDYKTHVRFVDTHSKRNSGHNHLTTLHQEGVLCLASHGGIHTGMIRQGFDIVYLQAGGKFFYGLAAQAIDDARFAVHLTNIFNNVFIYIFRLRTYFVHQVRTIETRLEDGCTLHT